MSTPNLKNSPEDAVRISGVYFSVETPSKRVAQRMANLIVEYVGIYTIPSGRIQDGRGDHILQVMAGRGDSGVRTEDKG